jgi:hypothetical protein
VQVPGRGKRVSWQINTLAHLHADKKVAPVKSTAVNAYMETISINQNDFLQIVLPQRTSANSDGYESCYKDKLSISTQKQAKNSTVPLIAYIKVANLLKLEFSQITITKYGVEISFPWRDKASEPWSTLVILATHKGVYKAVSADAMGEWDVPNSSDTVKYHIRNTIADDKTAPDNWKKVGTAMIGGVGADISQVESADNIIRVYPANKPLSEIGW